MTTIYIPRLIESAEQAEALPEGTTLTHEDYWPCEKWGGLFVGNDWRLDKPALVVGWTALVPIEAEEEVVWHDKWDDAYQRTAEKDAARLAAHPIGADVRRIFITPWESA